MCAQGEEYGWALKGGFEYVCMGGGGINIC